MMGRFGAVLLGLLAGACAHSGSSRKVEPSCCARRDAERRPLSEETEEQAKKECPLLAPAVSTQADFEKGQELVTSCSEMCMKSEEGGAKRNEGLALLRKAAQQGDLEAQAFYGRTKFTDLMTVGSEPELEGEYVEALYFLSLASRRGNAAVHGVLPQLETLRVKADGTFSEPLTEPLTYIEEGWVKAALLRAEDELPCYAK